MKTMIQNEVRDGKGFRDFKTFDEKIWAFLSYSQKKSIPMNGKTPIYYSGGLLMNVGTGYGVSKLMVVLTGKFYENF
jgi:hypothetical protein